MTSKDIYKNMSGIKEKYIEEATPMKKNTNKKAWTRWVAMAACLCLIVAGGAFALPQLLGGTAPEGEITRMTIDINPSIEFIVDENNKVVSVTALNDDGSILIAGEAFVGKTSEEAIDMTISLASETGYLVKGEAGAEENNVRISVSGNSEYARQFKKNAEEKAKKALEACNIQAQLNILDGLATDALKALVNYNGSYTEEELDAMTDQQLYDALALQRIETALLLTEEMRQAYYEAKEYEIRFAQRESTLAIIDRMDGIYATLLTGYRLVVKSYSAGIDALVQAKYDYLVSPESDYQKSLAALRDKKEQWLKQRNYVATLDVNGEEYASATITLQASREAYEAAEAAWKAAGDLAISMIDQTIVALETIETQLLEIEAHLPDSIAEELAAHAAETEAAINEAKDAFFEKFEAAHKDDIQKIEAELIAQKNALKQNNAA